MKSVVLIGNPIYGEKCDNYKEANAPKVVKRVPQIENVDGRMINASVRQAAAAMDW